MTKPKATGTLRVNVWNLLDDGLEAPIRGGLYRAQKHSEWSLTKEQEDIITDKVHEYLLNWFSETFDFDA